MRETYSRSSTNHSPFSLARKLFSYIISLSLVASLLTVFSIAPAFAYNSCGSVLGTTAGTKSLIDNTSNLKITPQHGTIFYIDSRRGIND